MVIRKVTRSRWYGRTMVAGELATILGTMTLAKKNAEYSKLGGPRLIAEFAKLEKLIQELRKEVAVLPITQDEKIIAKVKRKKEASHAK